MFDNFVVPSLLPAASEIFLAAMALAILMIDLLVKDSKRTLTFVLSLFALLGCAVIQVVTLSGETSYTFGNMFVDDALADLLKFVLYLTMIVVLFYSRAYVMGREAMNQGEYYVLALFATLGMMVMISANSFVTIYVGLELLSLSLYAMVGMNRDSVVSSEAAMKYFILGALASGILLYGMSMIYGATGSLEITAISEAVNGGASNRMVLVFGLVFLVAGLAFKLGAVPFHMWVPDVYQGSPTSVTLLIGSAPKLAAFAIVIRLLVGGLIALAQDWQNMLIILAVLSMAVGNVAAIAQSNIKRMLAYSAISHMGFMLLGMVTGIVDIGGRLAFNPFSYSSAMFYVISYVLMTVCAFGLILMMSKPGNEFDNLDDFKGLNKRNPWFAGVMLMVMFSMAGVPFFIGFFAKFAVIQSVVATGQIWLAIVAVLFSLIGAFYYLRVVKLMYFDTPADDSPLVSGLDMRILVTVNGLLIAFLGLFPEGLLAMCGYVLQHSLS